MAVRSVCFRSDGAPGPVAGPGDAGLDEGVNGDDIDVFPMQWTGVQATGKSRVPTIPRANDRMQDSQHVHLAAAMRARRGANVDVGREATRAGWGSAW